jgi:FkbH-like protein
VIVPFRICISASFTAEPLEPALRFWGSQLGVDFEVRFAPFQQVAQTLLNPAGEFAANQHGVNVAMVRVADLGARAKENAGQLADALRVASARDRCPLIFVLCPSEQANPEVEDLLLGAMPGRSLDYQQIEQLYQVETKFDPAAERLGAIPYTTNYFAVLATALARRIAGLSLLPYKVIAVDCDNTLWEGVCGEDGPAGVRLDPGRLALHEFLLRQRDAGMLLCLASKNNREDVMETFAQHPEMPLRPDHFTAMRLDWESKPENLASMAQELGLGLDSFIFLDDSAKECGEMREEQPQVLTLEFPGDPERIAHFLHHVWAFDHPVVTEEDRMRAESYARSREFGQAFQSAHSLEEFMASLDLRVEIQHAGPEHLARVAQLTQRTNQFNFTTIRRTEAEIRGLLDSHQPDSHQCLIAAVSDRFGDYGLTGAVLFQTSGGSLRIDSFLLSCRVLGRGVEHRIMAHLGALAQERGLAYVDAEARVTSKNQPALQFLHSIGLEHQTDLKFRFPAGYLAQLHWKPATTGAPSERAAAPEQHRFLPFARIASELSTVNDIVSRMQSAPAIIDESLTETERELALIWNDLLKVPQVKPADRFFDLGGHSLLAVLLISRVRERFGVELPVDDVYSGDMTLRDLATKIELMRSGGIESDEYEAMLAEIDALPDEEVRALLEQQ